MVRWLYTITVTGESMASQAGHYKCVAQIVYFINMNVCLL